MEINYQIEVEGSSTSSKEDISEVFNKIDSKTYILQLIVKLTNFKLDVDINFHDLQYLDKDSKPASYK